MSVSWEALTEDIQRAAPGSHLYYELIREAHRHVEEVTAMAKPKPPPPGTGKVPSPTGAKHDANGIRVTNSKGKLDGLGKHAKPGKK